MVCVITHYVGIRVDYIGIQSWIVLLSLKIWVLAGNCLQIHCMLILLSQTAVITSRSGRPLSSKMNGEAFCGIGLNDDTVNTTMSCDRKKQPRWSIAVALSTGSNVPKPLWYKNWPKRNFTYPYQYQILYPLYSAPAPLPVLPGKTSRVLKPLIPVTYVLA